MDFLFLLIIAAVAVYLLRRPLKAHPSFFYGIAVILDLLYFVGSTFGVPRWLWTPLVDLIQKCELALALFAIVMFIGCLGKEQALYRQMKPIRAELSIVACILCFGHMAVYLGCSAMRASTVMLPSPSVWPSRSSCCSLFSASRPSAS